MDKPAVIRHQNDEFLNPSSIKIKQSFRKRQRLNSDASPPHNYSQFTPKYSTQKGGYNPEEPSFAFRETVTMSVQQTKRKEMISRVQGEGQSSLEVPQYSFVLKRNKDLEKDVRLKTIAIDSLDRKCQGLQMRLLAQQLFKAKPEREKESSIPLGRSLERQRVSDKLKSIKDRLQRISFSGVVGDFQKGGQSNRRE